MVCPECSTKTVPHPDHDNMDVCPKCGMVGLHFEGSLPEIVDAIDYVHGE